MEKGGERREKPGSFRVSGGEGRRREESLVCSERRNLIDCHVSRSTTKGRGDFLPVKELVLGPEPEPEPISLFPIPCGLSRMGSLLYYVQGTMIPIGPFSPSLFSPLHLNTICGSRNGRNVLFLSRNTFYVFVQQSILKMIH